MIVRVSYPKFPLEYYGTRIMVRLDCRGEDQIPPVPSCGFQSNRTIRTERFGFTLSRWWLRFKIQMRIWAMTLDAGIWLRQMRHERKWETGKLV